jgi:phosphoribosyl 1,2-cyclic phosphodiesterase
LCCFIFVNDPIHGLIPKFIFTHGHVDHVSGVSHFDAEAQREGWPRPIVLAHEAVAKRFDRYTLTKGYNQVINTRQFGVTVPFGRGYRYPDVVCLRNE